MKRLLVLVFLLMPVIAEAQSAFLTRSRIADDPDFQLKIRFIVIKQSIAVILEEVNTPLHDQRKALGIYCLREPIQCTQRMSMGVVTNLTLTANSTDAEIETVLVGQWNAWAEAR